MKSRKAQSKSPVVVLVLVVAAGAWRAEAQDIPLLEPPQLMEFGREPGAELSLPSDVEIGADGTVYVVDSGNHRLAVFSAEGKRTATVGERGDGDGQMEGPVGLGLGPDGTVYVADKGNHRLQVFSRDNRFLRSIELEADGDAISPIDVAVSADGEQLFVTANESHRVVVFTTTGDYLRGWGGEGLDAGQFKFPGIIKTGSNGDVYVVDILNQRVQVFAADGTPRSTFGELGGRPGTLFRPKGLAIDDAGRSYVGDSFIGVVQVFDANGEFLYVLGRDGKPALFDTPVGLAVSGSLLFIPQMLAGNVLVLDLSRAEAPRSGAEAAE